MEKSDPAKPWLTRAAALRFAFVALTLTVAAMALANGRKAAPTRDPLRASTPVVRVAAVERAEPAAKKRFFGTVRASDEAVLAFPLAGRVIATQVEVGDRVKKGQLLAQLDPRPFQHRLAAARAGLTEATSQLSQVRRDEARLLELDRAGAVPTASREAVQTTRERAEASLEGREAEAEEAGRQLQDAHLYAAFDGIVTALHVERGEFVGPGVPVVAISGRFGFEVRLEVPESVALGLAEGSPVDVHLPLANGLSVSGEISRLGEATQGQARLFPVHVTLEPNPALRAGMTAEVSMVTQEAPGLSVPLAAIMDPSGLKPSVLRARSHEGRTSVERVEITPVRLTNARAVVRADLAPGDQVVTAGHAFLLDGDSVRVLDAEAAGSPASANAVARQPRPRVDAQ